MKRRGTPEADLQRAVVQALRAVLPRTAIIHHCANEVTEAGPRGAKRQAILVGMGVHPGFADLMVLCDGRVVFLELKSLKGRLGATQEAFRDAVLAQGPWLGAGALPRRCAGRAGGPWVHHARRGPDAEARAMSHEATNWAIKQRGLKPTTKIVLWHLCDRFNPDYGCFPSQDRLAEDCEISRLTLNEHLGQLEAAGLLRRVPRLHPITKRQMPTRSILGFEPGFTPHVPDPCPETGHGNPDHVESDGETAPFEDDVAAEPEPCPETGHGCGAQPVSDIDPDPCPENAESRVRNPDTNPVREPLSKPVKEEEGARAREAISEEFFGELLKALGLDAAALPGWWQGWPPREHLRRWRDDLGLDEDAILAVAEASRRDHPEPPDGPKALDRSMQRAAQHLKRTGAAIAKKGAALGNGETRRRKRDDGPRTSDDELAAFYADLVNSDRFLPPSTISNTMRDAMLTRGLVTVERLRERGVR